MRSLPAKIRNNGRLIGYMTAYGVAVLAMGALAVVAPGIENQATVRATATPTPLATVTVRPTVTVKPSSEHVVTAADIRHARSACDNFGGALNAPCTALYLRQAESRTLADGSIISNPAGPALVAECDQGAEPDELLACFTQPAL